MRCGTDGWLAQQALSVSLHARIRPPLHVSSPTSSLLHNDDRYIVIAIFVDHRTIVRWNHRCTLNNGFNMLSLSNHNTFHPARRFPFHYHTTHDGSDGTCVDFRFACFHISDLKCRSKFHPGVREEGQQ